MARDITDKTDRSPVPANEWGIPDWRDPAAYGDVKRWTFNRWRWEFYRRRDDLRTYFDANAEATFRMRQPHAGKSGFLTAHLQPGEPGFCAIVDTEARALFGYSALPNPRISDQPASVLRPWQGDSTVQRWEAATGHNGFRGTLGDLLDFAGVVLTDEQRSLLAHALEAVPANLGRDKIAIGFDLNRPLKPQVEMALVVLGYAYRERGRPVQRKRHQGKWLGYLRALDAKAAGASWAEIATVFFRDGLLDRRKDPAGGYCDPPPQAARDMWEAADALRFNF